MNREKDATLGVVVNPGSITRVYLRKPWMCTGCVFVSLMKPGHTWCGVVERGLVTYLEWGNPSFVHGALVYVHVWSWCLGNLYWDVRRLWVQFPGPPGAFQFGVCILSLYLQEFSSGSPSGFLPQSNSKLSPDVCEAAIAFVCLCGPVMNWRFVRYLHFFQMSDRTTFNPPNIQLTPKVLLDLELMWR